jgi:hypothetical protein
LRLLKLLDITLRIQAELGGIGSRETSALRTNLSCSRAREAKRVATELATAVVVTQGSAGEGGQLGVCVTKEYCTKSPL